MNKKKSNRFAHVINVVAIALIIECFLCSFLIVNKYGRENCFERISEITGQAGAMFRHSMEDNQSKLQVFADILGANSTNTDAYLQGLMNNFCETQSFTAVCIHRADGTSISMGEHPHETGVHGSFQEELTLVPYTSNLISAGDSAAEKFVYQAVPVVRSGKTVGILYGYLSLDTFPGMIDTSAYGGNSRFYIVDGDSGDILMDTYLGILGNLREGYLEEWDPKKGYSTDTLLADMLDGKTGYYVFRPRQDAGWLYVCYQSLGINNWSMQLTIDEATAFADFWEVNLTIAALLCAVVALIAAHLSALLAQTRAIKKRDKANLHRSNYISQIQRILLNAQSNPNIIDQALKVIAQETRSETVVLLSYAGKVVNTVHYWPSQDIEAANAMIGRNIRSDFPGFYDSLSAGESLFFDMGQPNVSLPDHAADFFRSVDIRNIMLVPVADHSGQMRGTLCAVNLADPGISPDLLECVTYDFFMTLTNAENLSVIRSLGTIDYMTKVKNRNSYETELPAYARADCQSLWCIFVDVNGLHEVNNTQGHKAGDRMLCAVADVVKRYFGADRTYRIGGDEFIAFAENSSREEMARRRKEILSAMSTLGYYVSIGFQGAEKNPDGIFEIEQIITGAESFMYQDKQSFYQGSANGRPRNEPIEV